MIEKSFEEALQKHLTGNLVEAELKYRKILEEEPSHADALHHLGLIQLQDGRIAQAVASIRESIAYDAEKSGAHSNLAYALNLLG
jgi:Flp pilus assembly protein TadD